MKMVTYGIFTVTGVSNILTNDDMLVKQCFGCRQNHCQTTLFLRRN